MVDLESVNKQVNALTYINPKSENKNKGKLSGKTIAIKANISVINMPISCASKTLEGYFGTYDADVVAKIKSEGAQIIGIANCDEFACGSSGETSCFGPTQNPNAPGRIPGGSSSGSAAAVAAKMCDMSLGTDTGGSIRNPASHCGIVGIKPSYGLVSRYGLLDMSMSLEGIGPFANSVEDVALLLSVIAGKSENDPTSTGAEKDYTKFSGVKGLKIGVIKQVKELCSDKKIYDDIIKSTEEFAQKTESKIIEIDLNHIDLAIQTYYPIVYTEFFSATRKYDGRKYGKKIEDVAGPEVLRRIYGGQEITKSEYKGLYYRKALAVRNLIKDEFKNAFSKVDVIMLPVTPVLPHKIGEKITDPRVMYAYDAFTIPANLAGICAGVVPCTKIDEIPVGMQFMAAPFEEQKLVNIMKSYQDNR